MSRRFYSPQPLNSTHPSVQLEGSEAHHLLHVMRAKIGDHVIVFDGCGNEAETQVTAVGRHDVQLHILSCLAISRELSLDLELGVALPKGDRQEWLTEKAVELGVTRLVPLETERGVARPQEKSLDKLRRVVIEASKQCGRNQLMEIAPPQRITDYLTQPTASATERWFAHVVPTEATTCDEAPAARPTGAAPLLSVAALRIAVGPEGGFTPAEANLAAAHGWQSVSLGARVLRTETAALALATLAAQRGRPIGAAD